MLALGLLGLEALGLKVSRNDIATGWAVAFFFLILTDGLEITLCCWRAWHSISLRRHWVLLTSGVLLGLVALVIRGWLYLYSLSTQQQVPSGTDYLDLLTVLDYVPAIILLSLPSGKPYLRLFFGIDAIQTLIIAYLVYIRLFAVVPFTHTQLSPISGEALIGFYDSVDVVLSVVLTLRFFASATVDEKRFYRVLCWYMWVDTILIALHNRLGGELDYASYYELLGIAPGLFFGILVLRLPSEGAESGTPHSSNALAEFFNIASPAFFTISLLFLSIDAARHYFTFGMGTLAAAFLLHAARAAVLQRTYERAQRSLQQARDRLEELSMTDALTGVANRRSFDHALETEWARASRASQPLSLLMIDIDYFKVLNDCNGHQAGDRCLVQVAQALRSALPRRGDLLARYGGEEFAVVLPGADHRGAHFVATSMQESVRILRIANQTNIGQYATISIGIATFNVARGGSAQLLLRASDRALYRAKENGRNRIEAHATGLT